MVAALTWLRGGVAGRGSLNLTVAQAEALIALAQELQDYPNVSGVRSCWVCCNEWSENEREPQHLDDCAFAAFARSLK